MKLTASRTLRTLVVRWLAPSNRLVGSLVVSALVLSFVVGPIGSLLPSAQAADTGFFAPSAYIDTDGDVGSPNNAFVSDDAYATISSQNDEVDYTTFGFPSILAGSVITGIEVAVEANRPSGSSRTVNLSLSWNNGTSFTTTKNVGAFSSPDSVITAGSAGDTWGRVWALTDFANANFRLRVDAVSAGPGHVLNIDQIRVRVHYGPAPSWPTSWTAPAQCSEDPSGDKSPSEADLVGTVGNPAIGFQEDNNYLYFRERVVGNPKSGGNWNNTSWVALMQTTPPSYQYLLALNGDDALVEVWQNTPPGGAVDFSPLFNDPADTVAWSGSATIYAQSSGSGPYFVDWAVPKSQLTGTGITLNTTKFFATSQNSNNYNKDHLDCYDQSADVAVTKAGAPDPVTVGGTLTYTITAMNNGPETATGVSVSDVLPGNVTHVSDNGGGAYNLGTGVWTVGTLTNGSSASLQITVMVDSGTTVSNTATVTATTTDPNTTNNSATATTGVSAPPQLTVVKLVTNDNGGTAVAADFTMQVTGTNVSQPLFPGSATGTTVTLDPGAYSVDEAVVAGYTKTLGTNCAGSIALGESKTCIVTNDDDAPSLTLVKQVTNDNGGQYVPNDWTLTATGPTTIAGAGGATSGSSFAAGTYTLSESGPTGYQASAWQCQGGSLNGSSLTLNLGETVVCTITNDDIAPQLTVTKVVVNDDGGTLGSSSFTIRVDGTPVTSGVQNTYSAGVHTVSEDNPAPGYVGTISGDCAPDGSITLNPGDVKSCTITNDDVAPGLTLIKVVTNDNGGTAQVSDFALFVGSTQVTSGTSNEFAAGTYTLSESGPTGYQASAWQCQGGSLNGSSLTLNLGETVVCTITNDDIAPQLTVVKQVVNDSGGTAVPSNFTMQVFGAGVSPANSPGSSSGTVVTLEAGPYSVGELGPQGYSASFSGDCSGTIAVGEQKTCMVVNDDIAPQLTVTKVVVNNSGTGTAQVGDFTLSVGQTPVTSGQAANFSAGTYQVSEGGPAGYTATYSGNCDAQGNVTLALGGTYSCTITNDDNAPTEGTLTVTKVVVNNSGTGTAQVGDFTLFVGQTPVTSGQAVSLTAGTYTISEQGPPGYTASFSGDCTQDGTVTVVAGESRSCTITNDDVADEDPPVSTFGNNRDHEIIETELVSLQLAGASADDLSGVASAQMRLYRLANEEAVQGEGFFQSHEEQPSPFQQLACSPLPEGAIELELVQLNLTSVGLLNSPWSHDWQVPGRGVYCAIVHATDVAGNVENTAIAGPFAYNPPAVLPPPGGGGGGSGGGGGGGGSPLADLSLTKAIIGSAPAAVGDTFTYTLTVANAGPSNASNVVVTDVLPPSVTYVGSTASQGSYDSGTGKWSVGSLAVGASATLQLTVTVTSSGTITNFASSISSENDLNPANNTATYVLALGGVAGAQTGPTPQVLGAQTASLPRTGGMPIEGVLYLSWLGPVLARFRRRNLVQG